MKDNDKHLPWFLRKTPFFIIAPCFPPLAYTLVLLFWKRMDNETKEHNFLFASLFLFVYSITWMPRTLLYITIAVGIYIFLLAVTFAALSRKMKK